MYIGPDTDVAHPDPSAIRAALERVVRSPNLRKSPQLVTFLRYVVEAVLDGRGARVKGYTVAVDAFGRAPEFDPQTDPIVRVEAARLRRALDDYYDGIGRSDPVRIAVPLGTYVPHFKEQNVVAADGTGEAADAAAQSLLAVHAGKDVLRTSRALRETYQRECQTLRFSMKALHSEIDQVKGTLQQSRNLIARVIGG